MLPKNRPPTHPGEILLEDFLIPLDITQASLAAEFGWPYARLNEIINGKRGITADSAISLAERFDVSPEFWLNLQRNWDLWHAMQRRKKFRAIKGSKKTKRKIQAKGARTKKKATGR